MTAGELAATHRAAFGAKGWVEAEFAHYLAENTVAIHGDGRCFGVFRIAGPEAEVLTLATHPDDQGQGRATQMLARALEMLERRGIQDVFLDVAEDNAAARALYARAGFIPFSERKDYFTDAETGRKTTAICMKAQLSAASSA